MGTTLFTKPLSLTFTINFVYMLKIIERYQRRQRPRAQTAQQWLNSEFHQTGHERRLEIAGKQEACETRGEDGAAPTSGFSRIIRIFAPISPNRTLSTRHKTNNDTENLFICGNRISETYFHWYSVKSGGTTSRSVGIQIDSRMASARSSSSQQARQFLGVE